MAGNWSCSACTFLNQRDHLACSICNAERLIVVIIVIVMTVMVMKVMKAPTLPSALKSPSLSPSPSAVPASKWSCSACTLENPISSRSCSVCGTSRPGLKDKEPAFPSPALGFDGDGYESPEEAGGGGFLLSPASASSSSALSSALDSLSSSFSFASFLPSTSSASSSSASSASASSPERKKLEALLSLVAEMKFTAKAYKDISLFTDDVSKFRRPSVADAKRLLALHPQIKTMKDRTKTVPVEDFILSTLSQGLPVFKATPQTNKEIVHCLQYIFYRIGEEKEDRKRKDLLMELALGYQSCQTVQAQTILSMYSRLTNVELSFEKQVLKMLSEYRNRVLDQLVMRLNPASSGVSDNAPSKQPSHIRNAYVVALAKNGVEVGGHGVAKTDVNQPKLTRGEEAKLTATFKAMLSPQEFLVDLVTDINQKKTKNGFARYIDLEKFYQWVMKVEDGKFDKFSIYYDAEKASQYPEAQSEESVGTVPYLSFPVARTILTMLGIVT